MTQPAKVQEPSMEEILASIRRIIADDEAKPPGAEIHTGEAASAHEASAAPAAKPVMNDIPPSPIVPAQFSARTAIQPVRPTPAPPSAAANASNSQDDIDALLNGLDEATSEDEVRPPLPDGEVFELTETMALPKPSPAPLSPPAPSVQPSFHRIEPEHELEFTDPPETKTMPRSPSFEPPPFASAPPPPPPPQQMLSRATVSAVESAFNSLASTVLSNNARTLEDLVKEMLRPMLKSWLDDNLPGLVERIVKAEIERVSRGR